MAITSSAMSVQPADWRKRSTSSAELHGRISSTSPAAYLWRETRQEVISLGKRTLPTPVGNLQSIPLVCIDAFNLEFDLAHVLIPLRSRHAIILDQACPARIIGPEQRAVLR